MNDKQLCPDFSDLNYDTIIDSFLPPVPQITVEQLLYPQEFIDVYELEREYDKICERKFKP